MTLKQSPGSKGVDQILICFYYYFISHDNKMASCRLVTPHWLVFCGPKFCA